MNDLLKHLERELADARSLAAQRRSNADEMRLRADEESRYAVELDRFADQCEAALHALNPPPQTVAARPKL